MFPITFNSPSEAVRTIYEMKLSNPSAVVNISYNQERTDEGKEKVVAGFYEGMIEFMTFLDGSRLQLRPTGNIVDDNNESVKSITITSIQSVEPKLEQGDKVFVMSEQAVGEITHTLPIGFNNEGEDEQEYRGCYIVYMGGDIILGHKRFPSRDLIKLPDLPSKKTD